MEPFWEDIRSCLLDSISELNRVVEEVRLLLKERSNESIESPAYAGVNSVNRAPRGGLAFNCGPTAFESEHSDGRLWISATLRKEGEFWTFAWSQNTVRVKASKGVRLLGTLIEYPHRQFHAIDLDRYERKDETLQADVQIRASNAGPILDRRAQVSYKERLLELRAEFDEAEQFNDTFRASKIRAEIELLSQELSRAFGINGQSRLAKSQAERARVRVTLAIKGAIGKISSYNSGIGWHLATTVRTGYFCSYFPSPNRSERCNKV